VTVIETRTEFIKMTETPSNVNTESLIYKDAHCPVEERVDDLLARMTLAEKLAQLGSAWVFELLTEMQFDLAKADRLMQDGIGQITRVGGASSLTPAGGATLANSIQRYLVKNTRLGIPAIVHEECISGYMARNATCFPQIIGLASTWQPELAQAMAAVVRTQMRAAGAHQGLSPVIDVTRDPRWGRVEETFGEDPYLVSQMGVNFVRGLQGDSWQEGVLATAKHFVGYGLSEGGMNWAPAHIPPRELREVFMRPFEAAVKEANLQSLMHAYHELDGVPCAASRELLTTILRDEWGFNGVVVSDYFGVAELARTHHLTTSEAEAALLALRAGVDVELPSTHCYGPPLRQAIEAGQLELAVIDQSVARVLHHKFMLGLFENPYVDAARAAAVFDTPAQRQLARDIAQQSLILLKNEGDLLPLPKNIDTIAVIGPNAHTERNLIGDYAYLCHIETLVEMRDGENVFDMPVPDTLELVEAFVPMKTILQAMREKLSNHTTIMYAKGCDVTGADTGGFAEAVGVAKQADVALLFVGGKSGLTDSCTCGEARDQADLNLTGVQEALIKAIHATGTPVVVVLVNGRPLSINWTAEHVPAIIKAWLPGEEGAEAVAEALFGDINPGGKLPITFPRSAGQIPIYYNHKPSGGRSHWKGPYADMTNKPLWPFGYGLSYTKFRLDNLQADRVQFRAGEVVTVSLEVTNIGARAGDEVVQLYVRDPVASVTQPVKSLKGFSRVRLNPGEQKRVTFALSINQLGFYNQDMAFVIEPGEIELMVGTSSDHLPLTTTIDIVGEIAEIECDKVFFSQVAISVALQ
jgi:beta-glucosidase